MSSKVKIYNIALSTLLLARQVTDTETDKITNEVRVLNQFWEDALTTSLQDMDLDGLSEPIPLELIANLNDNTGYWRYVYKYPSRCAFLRRLQSMALVDNRETHIEKRVALYNGQKSIFTNEDRAVAECIPTNVPLDALSPNAYHAVAYRLAYLSCPLVTGKGAKSLMESILQRYNFAVAKAQEIDGRENYNFDDPRERSEYVAARMS